MFLFDTYALIELMNKNKAYLGYANKNFMINDFIFAEFCYNLFKESVKEAGDYTAEIEPAIVHASSNVIKKAMKFRYENKKKKMSMTDCISYIMAREFSIKFLTGDKEFESLEGVEFVK